MDISIFFQPGYVPEVLPDKPVINETLADCTEFFNASGFPDWENRDIVIFGVLDESGSKDNKGTAKGPDNIREQLYRLAKGAYEPRIADLGNIHPGASQQDTWYAISSTISALVRKNIFPVILGGSQDITYANYLAYEKLEQTVNMVTIDNKLDLGTIDEEMSSHAYLGKIILHQPNFLFNFCNVALQAHYADAKTLELMEKLYFDNFRLGEIRKDITDTEPLIRNADILSFDVSAIRGADAPGNGNAGPNGLFGEEACQLCRYAGMSDKLSSAGFYEYNPGYDRQGLTAQLIGQMIWYLIDGYYNRKQDYPHSNRESFTKFLVTNEQLSQEIVFYKSNKSDRWWMDVPYPHDKRLKFERHHMVPCSYKDYQLASQGDMPDLWWKTYQKLS